MARATISGISNWQAHEPQGGGAFSGQVCSPVKGLTIRDVLNRQGKGFKTEFNLETMTYQFYSLCNSGILRNFIRNRLKFLFPVSCAQKCFGWMTVREYAVEPVPPWLCKCLTCAGKKAPVERYVLRLEEVQLVAENDAFPIYRADAWERLGCEPPTRLGEFIRKAEVEQADALADHLASKKRRTKQYLAATLALKGKLREKYRALLEDPDSRREHILHLKGLAEQTDYFDAI